MMDRDPSERNAHPRSESKPTDPALTAVIVTAPDGTKIGLAPAAPHCTAYWPGHSIHPIHARHVAQSSGDWVPAHITSVDGHYVEFETDSGTFRRWHHDPVLLRRVTEVPELLADANVYWCDLYYVLVVEVDGVGQALSLSESDDKPCSQQ